MQDSWKVIRDVREAILLTQLHEAIPPTHLQGRAPMSSNMNIYEVAEMEVRVYGLPYSILFDEKHICSAYKNMFLLAHAFSLQLTQGSSVNVIHTKSCDKYTWF